MNSNLTANTTKTILALAVATFLISGLAVVQTIDVDAKADKVKAEKATKEKQDKVKPDKSKEKKAPGKTQKKSQQVRFEVIVDGSQVGNLTDAAANYELTVAANGVTSKAKQIEIGNETEDVSNMQVVFNAKGLTVVAGDAFTATATALNAPYQTDSVTGTFADAPVGNSGKTIIVGTVDEPLVFSEIGQSVEEEIPDDFAQ